MAKDTSSYKPPKQVAPEHQETISEIGRRLKILRCKHHIPAARLCRIAKISRNSYHQIEEGKIYFSFENFLKVLNCYNIPIESFFDSNFDELVSKDYYSNLMDLKKIWGTP